MPTSRRGSTMATRPAASQPTAYECADNPLSTKVSKIIGSLPSDAIRALSGGGECYQPGWSEMIAPDMANVTFLGACGTVTGSCTLLEWGQTRVLVDCGLFQGPEELEQRNREPLPFDPASITAVVLTHAHLDHSGRLPLLVAGGFGGPIWCSK